MTMFNNWLAAFDKRTPSPLYSKPLMYLRGAALARHIPGSVVAPPPGASLPTDDRIAYCNMSGLTIWDLSQQFTFAARDGFRFIELDYVDSLSLGEIQSAATEAHEYGLGVIAKNPQALQIIAHPNVFGVIVERGAGSPLAYDTLRHAARKDGLLPVWFVFQGEEGSAACAAQIREHRLKGMGVTCSKNVGYSDSYTVLLPSI